MLCPALPTAFTPGYGSDYPDTPLGLFQASPAPRAQFLRECRGPAPFPHGSICMGPQSTRCLPGRAPNTVLLGSDPCLPFHFLDEDVRPPKC